MSVVALFPNSEFYEAYYAAAKIVSAECDIFLFKKRLGEQLHVPCAGFPKVSLDKFTKILQAKGYTVVVQTELNLDVVNQTSQVLIDDDDSQLDSDVDLIQESIDSLHICYSRLYYYASQRISNRFKQPGKYLLKCKAKEVRGFLEKLNKSLLCWQDANLQELRNPAFHQYLSDLAYIIRLVQYDSNLRQMNLNVLEALQSLYQALIQLIPSDESVQLSLFDSQVTFFEEIKESKFIHKVMIDFEWIPVLAVVGRLLRRFCEKVVTFPACLVSLKSSWRSVFSGRQLSFADIF
ncbi:MutS domain I protein [Coleofasciculus chthonoplastes PCC 7420]|uniref:MutS domain I protein n=1 Tax=Coleofasciculus chthonoplastes PCC 7420 TaxID=118168 RepID=B4VY55_9CYAN|nr:MutS domain I protein [Coleofasciculus chthonoplastes]EDX73223.1 MutS domain I protein [Coleofasciculus chthonoplastes PCC 7420]